MGFHPRIAPVKAAVFPLVKKDGMPEIARDLYRALKKKMVAFYDEKGAVGRRYRRQDEAGTPYCITIDGQTKDDQTVTIRDRDTLEQWRVKLDDVVEEIAGRVRAIVSVRIRVDRRKLAAQSFVVESPVDGVDIGYTLLATFLLCFGHRSTANTK